MSQARLILKLSQVGFDTEVLDSMNRNELLQAWATTVSQGKDKPAVEPLVSTAFGYDVELEKRKFEFEVAKWQAEKDRQAIKDHEDKIHRDQMLIFQQEALDRQNDDKKNVIR